MSEPDSHVGKIWNEFGDFNSTALRAIIDEQAPEMNKEIAEEVISQLQEASKDSNNIIFVFTEGEYVVTGIHVPKDALDGENGPVLLPGASDKTVIAAFSREFIQSQLDEIDFEEMEAGLQSDVIELQSLHGFWIEKLEGMVESVRMEIQMNPPQSWDDIFRGES